MAFIVTDCPDCGEHIILDESRGTGHCMYCGVEVYPEGRRLPMDLEKELVDELRGGSTRDMPWNDGFIKASEVLEREGADVASGMFSELLGTEMSREERYELCNAIRGAVVEWTLRLMLSHGDRTYTGGAPKVLGLADAVDGGKSLAPFTEEIVGEIGDRLDSIDSSMAGNAIMGIFELLHERIVPEWDAGEVIRVLDAFGPLATELGAIIDPGIRDADGDPEFLDRLEGPVFERMFFIAHLAYESVTRTRGMVQKDIVKMNRSHDAATLEEARGHIDRSFELLAQGDEEGATGCMMCYADVMFSPGAQRAPASRKARR